MKYSTFVTSRDVDLQGTVHYINANIYYSMLQNSVEINKLCISIDTSTSQKVEYKYALHYATSVTKVESDLFY